MDMVAITWRELNRMRARALPVWGSLIVEGHDCFEFYLMICAAGLPGSEESTGAHES